MLTLDPSQRISAKDALDAEYFWADPLPCDPKSLPKYESSHEFQTKKKRQQQRQNEEMAKRQKIQHPQQRARLPLIGQAQAHSQHWAGHNHPMGNPSQALVASGGLNHHEYGKPRGGPGGPNRYPPGGNSNLSVGGYCPDRSTGQGGVGFRHEPYPPQARVPSASGPGGFSSDYGVGPPSYLQNVQYGGSSEVVARGPNVPGNCNQPYSWQQQ